MNSDTLKTVIAEWLEEATLPVLTRRAVDRPALERLNDVLAIVGPRRAGKTFLMFQYIEELLAAGHPKDDILFLDLEDHRLVGMKPENVDDIFMVFQQLAGKQPRYVFLDEIQHLPDWSRVVRSLHNRRRFRIVISGSNSRLLGREVATELRGRYQDILVLPFSFPEILRHRGVDCTKATMHAPARRGELLKVFDEYQLWGGYPEALGRGTAIEKRQLLQRYFDTIFYKDILDRYNVRAKAMLGAMMSHCLGSYADLFSISGFEKRHHQSLGATSKRTIANYLRYLEEGFFVLLNEKFSFSPRTRTMNPKKAYLIDNGFRNLGVEFSENRGKALENIVAIELARQRTPQFYHRDQNECDFLVMRGAGSEIARSPSRAIQVTWSLEGPHRDRERRGLVEAMESFRIKEGLVLTYNEEAADTFRGKKYRALPVWKWLLDEK